MFKKALFISLVCIGLTVIMVGQATAGCCCNPRFCASWLRGSDIGKLTAYGDPDVLDGAPVLMRVFGEEGNSQQLTGTVICARWSPYKCIRDLRIKKCRKYPWSFICRSLTDQTIEYDNSDPIVAEGNLDCGDSEAICTETLKIFFDDADIGGQGQDICDDVHPGKWVYADFEPDQIFNEGIVVGIENIEDCPDIVPDLRVTERCSGDDFDCEEADPTEIDDYPGGYGGLGPGGYGGYGGFECVTNTNIIEVY